MGNLQDADRTLTAAVALTLDALQLAPGDAAAKRLATRYAAAIDAAENHAEALDKLGPKLLATLEALGATPQARAKQAKGGATADAPDPLAALRKARRT